MNKPLIHGAGGLFGGGQKEQKTETPVTAADNLRSKATARLIDVISEGPILGLVAGLQSVLLNKLQMQTAAGSYNYSNAGVHFRTGLPVQAPIPGFSEVENQFPTNLGPCKSANQTVQRIAMLSGGSGYTTATVQIVGGLGSPGGGKTSVSGSTRSGGVWSGNVQTDPNTGAVTGQDDNPSVSTVQATANAVISGGKIIRIDMTNIGANYIGTPEIRITGDGTGASAQALMGGGSIYTITDPDVDAARLQITLGQFVKGDEKGNSGDATVSFLIQFSSDSNPEWRTAYSDTMFKTYSGLTTPKATTAMKIFMTFTVAAGGSYDINVSGRNLSADTATVSYGRVSGFNNTDKPITYHESYFVSDLANAVWSISASDTLGGAVTIDSRQYFDASAPGTTITGKTTSGYTEAYRVSLPTGVGKRYLRTWRQTEDSVDKYLLNEFKFESATEIISSNVMYMDTAICGFEADSQYYSGSVPDRAYEVYGRIIRVPSNYDPVTRSYSAFWNGTFKQAYSNNPVWCFLDLLTHPRYGLGMWVKDSHIDMGALYMIAQYCDQLVDNKRGGTSPRFTLNTQIMNQEEAYSVLNMLASVFRGMIYWSTGAITATQDSPAKMGRVFTRSKVINGDFNYVGVGKDAQHSVARVAWNDPADSYKVTYEVYEDNDRIQKYGYEVITTTAFACTDQAQALRVGKWLIDSEKYANKVASFRAGWDASDLRPGDIIGLADPTRTGLRQGGRIKTADRNTITLDQPYTFKSSETYTMTVAVNTWGRCAVLPGSSVVNGTRTFFKTMYDPIRVGDIIVFGAEGRQYSVASVGSNAQLTLTTPYVGDGSANLHYTVIRNQSLVMSSYINLMDVAINNPGNVTTDTVTATAIMPVAPTPESDWIVAGTTVVPAQYRVQTVKEASRGVYEVVALEHDPNKYLRVEQDIPALPPITFDIPKTKAATPRSPSYKESQFLKYGVPHSRLSIFWQDGSPLSPSSGYYVSARTPNKGVIEFGFTSNQNFDYDDADAGVYTFYIVALGINGDTSQALEYKVTAGAWDAVVGPTISNLGLQAGYGSNLNNFRGGAPTWTWQASIPVNVDMYEIRANIYIYNVDTGNIIRREYNRSGLQYTYSYEQNYADNGGVPCRRLRIKVALLDILGRESTSATFLGINPVPDAPVLNLTATDRLVFAGFDIPSDPDYNGAYIWSSQTSGFNPLTTPPVYKGKNNPYFFDAQKDGTYYIRAAAYDTFSDTIADLNISAQKAVIATNNIFDVTDPGIPAGLVLTSAIDVALDGTVTASVKATWTAITTQNFAYYEVFASDGSSGFIGSTSATNVWERKGFLPGTVITLKLRSVSIANKRSDYSPTVSITTAKNTTPPANPTAFTVTAGYESVTLKWTAPANLDLKWVEVWGRNNTFTDAAPPASSTLLGTVPFGTTSFLDTLPDRGTRTYWLRSVNTSGVFATSYVGPLTATSLYIEGGKIVAGAIDATKMANGLELIGLWNSDPLPPLPGNPAYSGPNTIRWSVDGKLYTRIGNTWSKKVATADLTGKIGTDLYDTLDGSKLAGTLPSTGVSVPGAVIVGQGTLKGSVIDGILGGQINGLGSIAGALLATVPGDKITGQLNNALFTGMDGSKITGSLSNVNFTGMDAAKLTGQLVKTVIKDGFIETPMIGAGQVVTASLSALAVTASKMVITDAQNLLLNGDFKMGLGEDWYATGDVVVGAFTSSAPAGQVARLNRAGAAAFITSGSTSAFEYGTPCYNGDEFYWECYSQCSQAGGLRAQGVIRETDNTSMVLTSVEGDFMLNGIAWRKYSGTIKVAGIPAGVGARITLRLTSTVDNTVVHIANVRFQRRNGGELVVDGGIYARMMAADSVTTNNLVAGSVIASKMTLTDMSNSFLNPTFENGSADMWSSTLTSVQPSASALTPPGAPTPFTGYVLSPANGVNTDVLGTSMLPCVPGEEFYLSVTVADLATATANVSLLYRVYDANKIALGSFVVKTVTPSTVWSTLGEKVVIPALASYVQAGIRVTGNAATPAAGIAFTQARLRKRNTAELIVDGSIIAGKLDVNAVRAENIAANAVTARTVAISDFQNLINNSDFAQGISDGWHYSGPVVIGTRAGSPSLNVASMRRSAGEACRITAGQDSSNDSLLQYGVPCNAGDEYYFECMAYSTVANSLQFQPCTRGPGVGLTILTTVTPNLPANTWTKVAGVCKSDQPGRLYLRINQAVNGVLDITQVRLQRKNAGELVVDGTIVARHLAAQSITAREINVSDFQNLLVNGDFSAGGNGYDWLTSSSTALLTTIDTTTAAPDGAPAAMAGVLPAVNFNISITAQAGAPCNQGDQFYYEGWVRSDSASSTAYAQGVITRTTGAGTSTGSYPFPALAAGVWTKFSGSFVATAQGRMQLRLLTGIANTRFMFANVRFQRMNAAELTVDGSISARKLVIGGTLTSNMLLVGEFIDGANGWSFAANDPNFIVMRDGGGPTGSPYLVIDRGTDLNTTYTASASDYISIEPSTPYDLSAWVRANAATTLGVYIRVRWYDSAKAYVSASDAYSNGSTGTVWSQRNDMAVTSPSGTRYAQIQLLHASSSTVRTMSFANVTFRKQMAATMIADGAIITRTLSATAVTAEKLAAQSVTASKLLIASNNRAFNADCSQNLLGFGFGTINSNIAPDPLFIRRDFSPDDMNALCSRVTGTPTNNTVVDIRAYNVPSPTAPNTNYQVTAGAYYEFSVSVSVFRCTAQCFIQWLNASGGSTGTSPLSLTITNVGQGATGGSVTTFPRIGSIGMAPAGTTQAYLVMRMRSTGLANAFITWTALQFGAITMAQAAALEFSPYVDPGSTIVDGANVYTGTLDAKTINADTLYLATGLVGALKTNVLSAGSISADMLAVGLYTGNNLYNSDFLVADVNWQFARGLGTATSITVGSRSEDAIRPGIKSLEFSITGSVSSSSYAELRYQRLNADGTFALGTMVNSAEWYEVSAHGQFPAGCSGIIYLNFYNSSGDVLGSTLSSTQIDKSLNGSTISRQGIIAQAPAGSAYAQIRLRTVYDGTVAAPASFWTAAYFGRAVKNQTFYTPWIPQSATIISGGSISARSINGDQLNVKSIKTEHFDIDTLDPAVINGVKFFDKVLDAPRINASQIFITGTGSTRLSDWRFGSGSTIDGGRMQVNTLDANSLKIGSRGINVIGINFGLVRNASGNLTGAIKWTPGSISYMGDNGNPITPVSVAGSSHTPGGGTTYYYWVKDSGVITQTATAATAYGGSDNVIMATYSSSTGLVVRNGATIIDGSGINALSITGDQIAAGSVQADKLSGGIITATTSIFVGAGNYVEMSAANRNMIFRNTAGQMAVRIGYASASKQGITIWDDANNLVLDSAGTGVQTTALNGQIGEATLDFNTNANQLFNSDNVLGVNGLAGFYIGGGPTAAQGGPSTLSANLNASYGVPGINVPYGRVPGTFTAGIVAAFGASKDINGGWMNIEPGGWYEFSAYMAALRCTGGVYLTWLNSAGQSITTTAISTIPLGTAFNSLGAMTRSWIIAQAPANAVYAIPTIAMVGTGAANAYIFFAHCQFAQTSANTKKPGKWSPGMTGTQITTANVGVYMADAAIQTAQIGNAAINNAKIGDLQVNNAKIADVNANKISVSQIQAGNASVGTMNCGYIQSNNGKCVFDLSNNRMYFTD